VLIGGDWVVIPPPGTSCVNAGPINLDTEYPRTVVAGTDQWYEMTLVAGTYHVTSSAGDGATAPQPTVQGGSCPGGLVGLPLTHSGGTDCWSFVVLVGGTFWLSWSVTTGATATTFEVSAGGCPP